MGLRTITPTLPKPALEDGARVQLEASFRGQKCSSRTALETTKEKVIRFTPKAIAPQPMCELKY